MLPVNVPGALIRQLTTAAAASEVDIDGIERAYREVMTLIATDHMPRFRDQLKHVCVVFVAFVALFDVAVVDANY
jgi:hypothetical protein